MAKPRNIDNIKQEAMKKTVFLVIIAFIFAMGNMTVSAQIDDPAKKTENKGEDRVNKNVDDGIDKGFDKIEDGIGNMFRKKKKDKNKQEPAADEGGGAEQAEEQAPANQEEVVEEDAPQLNWAKYDFVPGDEIIFDDNQFDEENGEFPSKWDLVQGNVENAQFGGENVIMFRGGSPTIIPYLKNSDEDYLPDVFTVEFDLYLPNNSFEVFFYDRKNQKPTPGNTALKIWHDNMDLRPARSYIPEKGSIAERWAHIAIAYTNGKLKAYVDETRLINIPRAEFNPTGISLHCYHAKDDNEFYVKNFRIAEGGVKYYDRFMQDGKIIANGIRFDVNKATLKPESMGVINEICDLMKENPDINFSVEGHTDSDGDADFNQELSEKRAQTVVSTLEKMGISADRLTSKGWGETKPITGNDSPEGKATNRRVEFVKM